MRRRAFGFLFAASLFASTSAFANVSVTVQVDGEPTQVNDSDPAAVSAAQTGANTTSAGSSEGAGDITAGTLRCKTQSTALTNGAAFPICQIGVADTVTIHGPAGSVLVQTSLHVDGNLNLTAHSPTAVAFIGIYASLDIEDGVNDSNARVDFDHNNQPDGGGYTSSVAPAGSGTLSGGIDSTNATINASRTVTVGTPFTISANLSTIGGTTAEMNDHGSIDCGNTARLSITLPAGYTYTSSSGNFLTQPGAPGLALPPDGGVGVHGAPDAGLANDGGGSSGGDASISGGGDGGGSIASGDAGNGNGNGDAAGGGDDGGCNTAASSTGFIGAFAMAMLGLLIGRRRRTK